MEPIHTITQISEIELGLDPEFNYILFQRKNKNASSRDFSMILGFLEQLDGISDHTYYHIESDNEVVMLVKFQHSIHENVAMALFLSDIDEHFEYLVYGDAAAP